MADSIVATTGMLPRMGCIYRGCIRHRRFTPVVHRFSYKTCMVFLDLQKLDRVLQPFPFLGTKHFALGWFRRKDYHGEAKQALYDHIANLIQQKFHQPFSGRIFVLTHLRYWGFLANPIAVFYCFDSRERLAYVAMQVTNTPWREKTLYVQKTDTGAGKQGFVFAKQMHVSPFNPMGMDYHCRLTTPHDRLVLHLENRRGGECHTDATLILRKEPLGRFSLALRALSWPPETMKVFLGIYCNALTLWLKRAPFYPHPGKRNTRNTHCCDYPGGQSK